MPSPNDINVADVIRLNIITHFDPPPAVAGLIPTFGSSWQCVTKAPGNSFTVDSVAGLGFPAPLSFPVTFVGQPAPAQWPYPVMWKWTVSEQVDRDFVVSGKTIHVDRLDGTEPSAILDTPNFLATACDGTPRSFASQFGWLRAFGEGVVPGSDLTLHLTVDGAAIDVPIAFWAFIGHLGRKVIAPQFTDYSRMLPLVTLTTGALADVRGIAWRSTGGVVPIPEGPLPVDDAINEALVTLAIASLAQRVRDARGRHALQDAVRQAAIEAVKRLGETIGD